MAARAPSQPVADLADRQRAADERDPLVPEVEEVLDGEPAAEHVVDGDRAVRVAVARPVDDDHRGAAPGDLVEARVVGVDRGDQDALDPLLLEPVRGRPRSRSARLSLLQMNSDRSLRSAASSMPCATSVKNGLAASSIT